MGWSKVPAVDPAKHHGFSSQPQPPVNSVPAQGAEPLPPYEPGPYSPSSVAPAPQSSPAPGGGAADAQPSAPQETAASRMSYSGEVEDDDDDYDGVYDFSRPGGRDWRLLPDHIKAWFDERESRGLPKTGPLPMPDYTVDPATGRRRRKAYDPDPGFGRSPEDVQITPYMPSTLPEPEEAVTQYEHGPSADADQSVAKPYTTKDMLGFVDDVYNEAKPVSERTGLSLPFIIGHAATETGWGKRMDGNNLFNLEAGRDWRGPTMEANGRTIRAYPSYKESLKDYIAHFRNTPGYTGLFDSETRTDPRKLAEAVQYGGFRQNDPLYAKKIMVNVGHPLISRYGEEEG